jgi:hypothetical protein
MRTNGSALSDAWMVVIPLGALVIFTSFTGGGPDSLLTSLDGLLRSAVRSVVDFMASLL